MGELSKLSVEVDGTEVNKVIKYKDVKNPFYRQPDIPTKTKKLKKLALDKNKRLRPGDLIFFNIPRKKLEENEPAEIPSYVIHVGIVISVHDNDYIEYVHATAKGVVTAWLRKDHDVMFFRYPMDRRQNNAVVARAVQLAKQMVGYPYSSKQRIRMTKFIKLLTRAGASLSLEELQANTVVGEDEVNGHEFEVGNSNASCVKFIPPAGLKMAVRLSRESAALPLPIMRMYKLAMRPSELILGSNTTRRECDPKGKSSDAKFVEWRGVCCDQAVITVYQVAELQVRGKVIRLSELCQSFPELTIVGISNSSPDVKRTEALLAQMDARDDNENTSLYKHAIVKTRAWLSRLDDKRASGINVRVKEGHVPATVGMCGSPRSASALDPKISDPQVLEAGGSFECFASKKEGDTIPWLCKPPRSYGVTAPVLVI